MPTMIERIVRWTVDGKTMPPFLCTPEALDELAVGHLVTQGMVDGRADVAEVSVHGLSVAVSTANGFREAMPLDTRLQSLRPIPQPTAFSLSDAQALMVRLLDHEVYYGTHCLALQTPDAVILREDIGRHNALDKVIGRGLLDGIDFSRCAVAATGRISLEMLIKAASVRIPCIVSKKYPSDLAAEHARRLGIRIIGKASAAEPIFYA